MKVSRKCAAMVLALPVAMIALRLTRRTNNTLKELSTEYNLSRLHHKKSEEKYAPLISGFDNLTMSYANDTYTSPIEDWKKRKKKKQRDAGEKELHYHDYAIFIVMYHKTGFVLTRQLKKAVTMLEVGTHFPNEAIKYQMKHTTYGIDSNTGEKFAFDTFGGWVRSAFVPRHHSFQSNCPQGYRTKPFRLKSGQLYLQESPDLFCGVEELEKAIFARKAKIIHFVRNPFDMVLSNYLYHSQEPSPEKWVHVDDPCHATYEDGQTLASNVLPSIGTDEINDEYFSNIVKMCRSLFQSKSSMRNSTFYEHLLELDAGDGLRLATAQMIAASGDANKHLAGGDVARMANNIVKLKELQAYAPSEVEVLTMSTEQFIKSAANSTMRFLDFVFGANNAIISREKRWEAAQAQQDRFDTAFNPQNSTNTTRRKKKSQHITQSTTQKEKKNRETLKELLHNDQDLFPILQLTESLVNEALAASVTVV